MLSLTTDSDMCTGISYQPYFTLSTIKLEGLNYIHTSRGSACTTCPSTHTSYNRRCMTMV